MLADITIESASTVENAGSWDSGTEVVEMENLGYKTKRHHMGGPSSHVHLDHNYSLYDLFNLMMSGEFRSGILQEWMNMRVAM